MFVCKLLDKLAAVDLFVVATRAGTILGAKGTAKVIARNSYLDCAMSAG